MGQAIDRTEFSAADYQQFSARLHDNLAALKQVLAMPGFGQGPGSVGAELELYLIDAAGQPVYRNQELRERSGDPQLALELNRFNLEYNLSAVSVTADPLGSLEREIGQKLAQVNSLDDDVSVIPIGILPTLRKKHFGAHAMTDERRYQFLNQVLQEWHPGPLKLSINGHEPLACTSPDITLEGACTSFQLHYRVRPDEFACVWNIAQLVAAVVLALSANSPFMVGRRCWMESRVPVFRQTID
ncbi:MAG TPA: glutamate-cysteine ligase family protein, partial [Motiliproteus sp.]